MVSLPSLLRCGFASLLLGWAPTLLGAPLTIDLTTPVAPAAAAPYGPGTTRNPAGEEITADQRSILLNGQPWVPIVGEFHYARYPREEWRDELLKMKAGGLNTVSTYVFWIHHEEEKGKWDWSGQRSLRDFLKLAQESGLKVVVRMGPWCHGEVRNGGFPDWVQRSGTKLRTKDPEFLSLVEPFFQAEAQQMRGLLWKDGGPVIGVQLDNENDKADYLLALKEMARAAGVDVPLYLITGWQGGLPRSDLIPLFGGYVDGFWGGSREGYRKEFLFTDVRAVNDLGAQLTTKNPVNGQLIAQFPYACAEIGAGMMSAYGRRIKVDPPSVAALTLAKLGSGNNMPGYYMYHGGTNPEGKLTYLHEDRPNQLPVKDYDFQAPLGAAGQVREQYQLLREQHLFLQDFGPMLARMPAYFPAQRPRDLKDFDTLRWNVRSDGTSGFLFFSNQQPYEPLPEHRDVQFEVKTSAGSLVIPRQPITIPTGSYGLWPVNLDCAGVAVLEYATAQPLCRMAVNGSTVYFLMALDGIDPELLLSAGTNRVMVVSGQKEEAEGQVHVTKVKPGLRPAVSVVRPDGSGVHFIVLTGEQGRQFHRTNFAGRERGILADGTTFADGKVLSWQPDPGKDLDLVVFPPLPTVRINDANVQGVADGSFTRFKVTPRATTPPSVGISEEKPAGPRATTLKGNEEATWEDAAVYRLDLPASAAKRRMVMNLDYLGDALRLYVGDKLLNDNYFNGDPFAVALWRIPMADWLKIRVRVLPATNGLLGRWPADAKSRLEQALSANPRPLVNVTLQEQTEFAISPP